ncbi:carboxymuconolactone decarboxylase family protein [Mycobacterium basiliense]|nr:carboxymuconolactone decarboxylase family protein [Mycobacterium basiliense]
MPNQDQVEALDPVFGKMAVELGQHAWSLPQLTMREKSFVFMAADLCTANLGFPLLTHVQMAGFNGVTPAECAAGIRHLAPYVGYPTAAVALQQLRQQRPMGEEPAQSVEPQTLPPPIAATLEGLDEDFARFFGNQFDQRWGADASLTPRERALSCLAADVLNQTLDESFALHVELAVAAGAGREQVKAVLLLVAEFGIAKSWRAYRALDGLTA